MLAFARAAMARPKLLLMDESSLGLSPRLTQDMFAAIARYRREDGPTVLLVEQNVALSLRIANYVCVMETGRIVAAGRPETLAAGGDIARYYLGAASGAA